jgi:glycosyltransferase involved in cell wall biosynthesis
MMSKKKLKKNKKSILFLLTQDLESPSGLGRYFPLCKNLVKQGFCVEIAALHSNYQALEKRRYDNAGVTISYLAQMHVKKENNQTKYFSVFQLMWYSFEATLRLLLYILINPSDMVVIGKPHPMNSIAGLIGGKINRAKIILDCDDYEAASNYFSSSWQRFVIKLFEDTMPKLVHKVVTNTIFNKDRMVDLGVKEGKILYLPNGIDLDRYLIIDEEIRNELAHDLGLSDKKVVAYIGSLSLLNHPVDLLITAFKKIHDKHSDIKLLIVGGGKDIKKLESLVISHGLKEDVIFTGRVSPNQVPYYYDIADVSVDPVYDNNVAKGRCPLKMFESWIMKTAFITAAVGDRALLAGSPPATLFFDAGDPIDLSSKIVYVFSHEKVRERLSLLGYNLVQEYNWSTITRKFSEWIIN